MNYLVTGAGSGIGFYTVMALLKRRGNKVICISRNEKNLQKLKNLAMEEGESENLILIPTDLSLFNGSDILKILKKYAITSIDGLVNNAGLLINKPFIELTEEDFKEVYEVNVFAPVKLIKLLLPFLKESLGAHIVNISSLGGFQGSSKFVGLSAYSSSKAALACLTECMAIEFRDLKISCNALALGAVDTEMLQQAFPGYKAPLSAIQMGTYIAEFTCSGHLYFNGKVLPVALAAQ